MIVNARQTLEDRKIEILAKLAKARTKLPAQSVRLDSASMSSELIRKDEVVSDIRLLGQELSLIIQALKAIKDGVYGTCQDCGNPIAPRRLLALPFAIRCIACEEVEEERRKKK